MNKRPLSITIIGCIFILAGVVGVAYHSTEFKAGHLFEYELVLPLLVRTIAVICGVFLLRGSNWARWLLLAWIAYHVVLSAFHSISEVVMHALLFIVVGFFLFRPHASAYFRSAGVPSRLPETER